MLTHFFSLNDYSVGTYDQQGIELGALGPIGINMTQPLFSGAEM